MFQIAGATWYENIHEKLAGPMYLYCFSRIEVKSLKKKSLGAYKHVFATKVLSFSPQGHRLKLTARDSSVAEAGAVRW